MSNRSKGNKEKGIFPKTHFKCITSQSERKIFGDKYDLFEITLKAVSPSSHINLNRAIDEGKKLFVLTAREINDMIEEAKLV